MTTTPPPTANSSRSGSLASWNSHTCWPLFASVAATVGLPVFGYATVRRSAPTVTGPRLAKNWPGAAVFASAASLAPGSTVMTGGPDVGGSVPRISAEDCPPGAGLDGEGNAGG